MSREIPISIIGSDQLQAAILDLERAAEHLREQAVAAQGKTKSGATEFELGTELQSLIEGDVSEPAIQAAIEELKGLQKTAPVVEITLAAVPGVALKQALVRWFRHTIAPQILVDFVVNRELAGGAVVRAGGQVFDWSFRSRILDGRHRIAELVSHV